MEQLKAKIFSTLGRIHELIDEGGYLLDEIENLEYELSDIDDCEDCEYTRDDVEEEIADKEDEYNEVLWNIDESLDNLNGLFNELEKLLKSKIEAQKLLNDFKVLIKRYNKDWDNDFIYQYKDTFEKIFWLIK